MTRVLVPFDFSPHSRRALALAMQGFPFGPDTEVEMLHVIDEDLYANVLAKKYVPSEDAIDSYMSDELTTIEAELAIAMGAEAPKLLHPTKVITRGRPHAIIDERMQDEAVIGCLLGGQGHGGATEKLLGRTAQRVIRHAEVPTLVVKRPHTLSIPTRMLAAVDWSANSKRALLLAAQLRGRLDALLSVLHVIDSPYVPYVQAFAHEQDAREALDTLKGEQLERLAHFVDEVLSEREIAPVNTTQAVVFGDPAITIASQAQTLLSELIVVGAHGSTNLARYLLGSTAEKLITAAASDILVVP